MKKTMMMATAAAALMAGSASAEDVKIGVILGYTGPIESLTPHMAESAELAMEEINESGAFMDGMTLVSERADSTCIDSSAAAAAAERLITSEGIKGIMGADCSGVTGAILSNVAVPNGMVMISPSATSPGLSTAEDNGLFFRTAPSDARQGEVLAEILDSRDIDEVAVTYTNNDYGKGLSDSFVSSFEEDGGTVTLVSPHEDNKADYSAEVGALASAGGDVLVVLGYADSGGKGMIRASLDTGAFDTFMMGDGMYGDALMAEVGADMPGSFGAVPWSAGPGAEAFAEITEAAGINGGSSFTREICDAAAVIALAMQSAGSVEPGDYKTHVMDVANAPGEKIYPGELGKALEIIADGGEVDYEGATAVELIGPGEAAGTYREYVIEDADFETVKFH